MNSEIIERVLDGAHARQGYPWGRIRSAVLSIDGGPPIDVTGLNRPQELHAVVQRYFEPFPVGLRA